MAARTLVVAAVLFCCTPGAAAQQSVSLQFQDGRVTLRAQNAPVRAILAEWARLGGATIVNGDRVTGPPVTLELTDVLERQALDVVLRNVAGYMIAPRRAGAAGASAFDRIMILPTSVAPRNPPPGPAAAAAPRPVLPRPGLIARPPEPALVEPPLDNPSDAAGEPDAPANQPPPPGTPPGPPRPAPRPIMRPLQPGGSGTQILTPEEPDDDEAVPAQDGVAPTPANPFGIPPGSSATPGVIAPVPQPQQTTPNRVQ